MCCSFKSSEQAEHYFACKVNFEAHWYCALKFKHKLASRRFKYTEKFPRRIIRSDCLSESKWYSITSWCKKLVSFFCFYFINVLFWKTNFFDRTTKKQNGPSNNKLKTCSKHLRWIIHSIQPIIPFSLYQFICNKNISVHFQNKI